MIHLPALKKRMHTIGFPMGLDLLLDPFMNKGTAFTQEERDAFGLNGLLPPVVQTMDEQVTHYLESFRKCQTDLDKYISLISLQDRNRTLFYRVVLDNLEEMTPIIYTPTVGSACLEYGSIFRRSRGIYISAHDEDRMVDILKSWPFEDLRVIVVTDGSRILGLGDLGAHGMGIPVGKLGLYTACAGVHPTQTLPITLDIGTDNETLRESESYLGLRQPRLSGEAYDRFLETFMTAVNTVYPDALVQFEDFSNTNAFRLLDRYRNRICCFNDDIQGTGASALAGILSALRISGGKLADQRFLFLGAGEAGLGIGDMIVSAMKQEGLSGDEARSRCRFWDVKGLLTPGRPDLSEHQMRYACVESTPATFMDAIESFKPTALIGVCGCGGMFTEEVIRAMGTLNERPILFAMSNPTTSAECTAEEAYAHTDGRAIYASGSPFPPVKVNGQTCIPGQANNVYIFPGVGMGVAAVKASRVTDDMFFEAAKTVAGEVRAEELAKGSTFPALDRIRDVSMKIAVNVAKMAFQKGLAGIPEPKNLEAHVAAEMYIPDYPDYVAAMTLRT